jgi:hypothetical protein
MALGPARKGKSNQRIKGQESIELTRPRRLDDEVKTPPILDGRNFKRSLPSSNLSSYLLLQPNKFGFALFLDKLVTMEQNQRFSFQEIGNFMALSMCRPPVICHMSDACD